MTVRVTRTWHSERTGDVKRLDCVCVCVCVRLCVGVCVGGRPEGGEQLAALAGDATAAAQVQPLQLGAGRLSASQLSVAN